jgi:signal transduction histidine kinase
MNAPNRRVSLLRKLQLLICGLVLGVVVVSTAMSYSVVKRAAVAVGRERVQSLSGQLASMLSGQVLRSDSALRAAVTDSGIVRYVRAGRPGPTQVLDRFVRSRGRAAGQLVGVELLGPKGEFLTGTSPRTRGANYVIGADLDAASREPRFYAIGRIRPDGDTLVYPVVAAVRSSSATLGYLVAWSKIASAPEQRRSTLRLLGSGVEMYFGNDSVWTNLIGRVEPPPATIALDTNVAQYARAASSDSFVRGRPAATRVLGVSRPIVGTPWRVLIEVSEDAITASAESFLRISSVIGLVLVAIGFVLAWWLARTILQPVARLTAATSAVARGDFREVADASRPDELGSLAAAFNTMSAQVRDTQAALEDRVRERTRKLEERNEELEAFAYTVAHDLRAPIRAMHGFSDALLEDFSDVLGYRGRDYAKRIVDAARRMDALVRDLLEYSQIVRSEIVLKPVELSTVVKNVIGLEEQEIRVTGADVAVDGALPTVMAHQATLSQAVLNLVGNALKFVPPGKTPQVRIFAERRESWTRLWVSDNGLGIAQDQHETIFRVFERLHRREEYPGTGIGLAIVRKGVERMGGRTGVESAPGSGSRFWIDLPAAESFAA